MAPVCGFKGILKLIHYALVCQQKGVDTHKDQSTYM